jgi:hypothetical protein
MHPGGRCKSFGARRPGALPGVEVAAARVGTGHRLSSPVMHRRLLAGICVAAAVGVAAGCGGGSKSAAPPYQRFESRPDLKPPVVTVTVRKPGLAPGYIVLGPKQSVRQQGPLIVDDRGRVVWFHPGPKTLGVADVRVQRYHGQPVLTWWHGKSFFGYGSGSWVIVDGSYHRLAEVYAGNGALGDQHDFTITKRNTALVTVYHRVAHVDLRPVGGKEDGVVLDSGVQEIDIATGKVLFDWRALAHVGIRESY